VATRIYFPSSGAAPVTPSGWLFTSQIAAPVTFKAVIAKISSALTNVNGATSTTNPILRGMGRWVIGPLANVQISGTIKGQFRCTENNAGASATLAVAIKIIQPGGADRATLLSPVASDAATTVPPEMLTGTTPESGAANRSFNDTAESASITLTNQTPTAGDYLVIEVGFRSATGTSRTIYLRYGDNGANDLPENQTGTNDYVPWIEFSQTLSWQTTTYNESGTLTSIPGLIGSDKVVLVGGGAVSGIPSETAAELISLLAAGIVSSLPSLTSQDLIAFQESGLLNSVPVLTGIEELIPSSQTYNESGTLSVIPSLAGDSVLVFLGADTLSGVPSVVGVELLSLIASGVLTTIPSLTGTETTSLFEGGGMSAIPTLTGMGYLVLGESGTFLIVPSLTEGNALVLVGSGTLFSIPSLTGVETFVGLQTFDEGGELTGILTLVGVDIVALVGSGAISSVPSLVGDDVLFLIASGLLSTIPNLVGTETFSGGALTYDEGGVLLSLSSLSGSTLVTLSASGVLSSVPSLVWISRGGTLMTIRLTDPTSTQSRLGRTSIQSSLSGGRLEGNGILQIQ